MTRRTSNVQSSLEEAFKFYLPGDPPAPGVFWLWPGGTFKSGYGRVRAAGKIRRAHRVSYEIFNGPIPDGLIVRHRYDVRLDVNPHNLLLGTHADNRADMIERDRHVYGSRQYSTKLVEKDVIEIREAFASKRETAVELATSYRLSVPAIYKITSRRSWKHI